MDSLARPIGGNTTIKWQGKTYQLSPLTVRDFGTIENEMLRRRREAKLETIASLYGKLPEAIWNDKYKEVKEECETLRISMIEVQRWIDFSDGEIDGLAFTLWLSLSKLYPGQFVLEDMLEVLATMADESPEEIDRLIEARDQASGFDAAGNAIGPA